MTNGNSRDFGGRGGRARPGWRYTASPAAIPRTVRASARRLSWGLADQAVSSMTNFIVGICVARSLGAMAFGIFSLAWVTYGVVLNISRGLATDPLVVRFSGVPIASWRAAVSRTSGTALLVGLVTGVASLLVGAALGGPVGAAFVALGLVLPALLLQDSWRFAFFAAGQGRKAFMNDIVWGVTLFPAMIVAAQRGNVFGFVLAWGLSGAIAAAYGCVQTRFLPRLTGIRAWLHEQRDLGSRYLIENVSNSGAAQLRMYGLGAIAGLADVGTLRGAELLLGPFLAAMMGLNLVAVPEAARVLQRSRRRLPRFCLLLGGAQAVAALMWGLALLFLLPYSVGQYVLGSVWHSASVLILPVSLSAMNASFSTGAAAGLRALGAARRSLRAQLLTSAAFLTGGLVGAAVAGALGSTWGVALATLLGAAVWWSQLRAGLRELAAAPPPPGPQVAVAIQVNHEEMRNS
jgi:O-antigen/teichoic acid export membrane protein